MKENREVESVKKVRATLAVTVLAAAIVLVAFAPTFPEEVTAESLDGGLLLTNEMKSPSVGAAPADITQSAAFAAQTQGRTYVYVGEVAGSPAVQYDFQSLGDHVEVACNSYVYQEVTDVLSVDVPYGNISYVGNLTEVSTPYLDFGNMTFYHYLPLFHCTPYSISMGNVPSHMVFASVAFAMTGSGAVYAQGIGYLYVHHYR